MSEAAVNGSGAPLTMEPDAEQFAPVESGDVETGIIGESMDGEDEHEIDDGGFSATELTPEQIAAGLQRLSGGIATAQDVENAARAEEGLPPIDQELPLDFGPFNADAALKAIFEKQTEIKALQADYDDKKEAASEAKKDLDKANREIVAIIDALKNRRQQALNPSQPYLREVTDTAPAPTGCPWELAHPGQHCPICTEAKRVHMIPAVESEVHPEHEGHAAVAEAARRKNLLEPLAEQLAKCNVYVTADELADVSTEDLEQLVAYVAEPSPIPPQILAKTCLAEAPGSLIQICGTCERVLRVLAVAESQGWLPVDARVGFSCTAAYVVKSDETHEHEKPIEFEGQRAPRSHAKKNRARKTAPEVERKAQADEGKKRSTLKAKKAKAAKRSKR